MRPPRPARPALAAAALALSALALSTLALSASGAAAQAPALTVYTYDSFVTEYGPGPQLETLFEAGCGCDLRFVAAGDGAALLGRLKLEGARTQADVVLGLDTNLVPAAAASGLIAPHGVATPAGLAVPGGWDDPSFLPYDWGWFAFVHDATRLADAPDSFAALLDAPQDVTLLIQDPRTSTPGLGLAMWVRQLYGDRAEEVWARLAPRIVTVTPGWWEAYAAFLEGEAAMVLSYTTSPAYHAMVDNDPTKRAAIFAEGHPAQIEVAALTTAARDPDLARRFLTFLVSDAAQAVLPATNWMYPAVTPAAGLPEAFAALPRPDVTLIPPAAEVERLRAEAVAAWRDGLSR
jgi:thiamine transport system substrate-binding protein